MRQHHPLVRTTLDDDDLMPAVRELVAGIMPVVRVPAATAPITPEMVRRALDED
jgi:hypothetical protein